MSYSEQSDREILSLARSMGLMTDAPFGDEIVRSYRALNAMAARIETDWTWSDEPAFRFEPEPVPVPVSIEEQHARGGDQR